MVNLVNSNQMQEIDRQIQTEYGMNALLLMENAGFKTLNLLKSEIWKEKIPEGLFIFLVGRGNNGGDASVLARQLLSLGKTDLVIILTSDLPPTDSAAANNLEICRKLNFKIINFNQQPKECYELLAQATYIFDGILGTGLKGEIRPPLKELINYCNELKAMKVALDIPSGIGEEFKKDYLAFKAEITISMGLPKLACYLPFARPFCGQIYWVDLGFPICLLEKDLKTKLLNFSDFKYFIPSIPATAYKNSRGHCAVLAGESGKTGAAILASLAAARTRTGLVTLYTDDKVYPICAGKLISVMCHPLFDFDLAQAKKRFSAILLGPGFGLSSFKKELLLSVLKQEDLSIVLDADGLTLLSQLDNLQINPQTNLILTPHPGELSRLINLTVEEILENPFKATLQAATKYNSICILKSYLTIICNPDGQYFIADGLNPSLGTAGSGDILAGLIAGFLSQKIEPLKASILGVLLHSEIGYQAFKQKGWFLAEDLIDFISQILKDY